MGGEGREVCIFYMNRLNQTDRQFLFICSVFSNDSHIRIL